MTDCLDSWAVLCWLEGAEPGASRVEQAMQGLHGPPVMSWINLGEVSYVVERSSGDAQARRIVRELRRRLTLDLPTEEWVLAAAVLKARHRMGCADAFAVATALALGASLLTGDPEIVAGDESWPIVDLR